MSTPITWAPLFVPPWVPSHAPFVTRHPPPDQDPLSNSQEVIRYLHDASLRNITTLNLRLLHGKDFTTLMVSVCPTNPHGMDASLPSFQIPLAFTSPGQYPWAALLGLTQFLSLRKPAIWSTHLILCITDGSLALGLQHLLMGTYTKSQLHNEVAHAFLALAPPLTVLIMDKPLFRHNPNPTPNHPPGPIITWTPPSYLAQYSLSSRVTRLSHRRLRAIAHSESLSDIPADHHFHTWCTAPLSFVPSGRITPPLDLTQPHRHVRWLTRIATGHIACGAYQHRFSLLDEDGAPCPPTCPCGSDEPQTVEHIIHDCLFGDFAQASLLLPTGQLHFPSLLLSKSYDLHRFILATYAFTGLYGTSSRELPPPYRDKAF